MYIRNGSGPIVEPWRTHALTSAKEKSCPLSTTICFPFLRKLNNKLSIIYYPTVIYYHKALHLGCCSSPRSASVYDYTTRDIHYYL